LQISLLSAADMYKRRSQFMQDRIEQQIVINAPLDRVWDLVSVPGWWVPTEIETEPDRMPGSQTVRESARWGRFPVEVVEMRPPSYAAFRWASQAPGADLAARNTTLVEFFVADAGQGITVTVVESGFAALDAPEEVRQSQLKDNTGGWSEELGSLRARAEEPASA
jgi:uncharacterized protein YndB with AHSA1/START domain